MLIHMCTYVREAFRPKTRKRLKTGFALHVVFFIRNVVKMCTVAIFRFCTVVSYFFPGILDSRFLVVYENMQNFVFGFFFLKIRRSMVNG